jgi:hypothetical protein
MVPPSTVATSPLHQDPVGTPGSLSSMISHRAATLGARFRA